MCTAVCVLEPGTLARERRVRQSPFLVAMTAYRVIHRASQSVDNSVKNSPLKMRHAAPGKRYFGKSFFQSKIIV
jgi:hypothetical protein